ncbi:LysR family transcriptional regulator [Anopheles sinensis]|uniref:LysR family transcriptional regulator n=1 Tax=Anopheles sinensis TaxID=74873 RepID=A0A084VWQ1_ANOSI|nr:LysR family transcriptional regulator [Anopheles sinensis]
MLNREHTARDGPQGSFWGRRSFGGLRWGLSSGCLPFPNSSASLADGAVDDRESLGPMDVEFGRRRNSSYLWERSPSSNGRSACRGSPDRSNPSKWSIKSPEQIEATAAERLCENVSRSWPPLGKDIKATD